MFTLQMKRYIAFTHDCIHESRITITKTINLPFAPFFGLIIINNGIELKIEHLYWDHDLQIFISEFDEESKLNIEALQVEVNGGWKVEK